MKPFKQSVRPLLYARVFNAGVLLCASFAHADASNQLQSIQTDIATKERAIRQQQQQQSAMLDQIKQQEEAILALISKTHKTQSTIAQLNKQIDEMNTAIVRLERECNVQEHSLATQLDAAFRQGNKHTSIKIILSSEERQRGQRLLTYFGYLNRARQETIAQIKQTCEKISIQKAELEKKQNQQKILLYEQQGQQVKLEQARNACKKTNARLVSSIRQNQNQLSDMRTNESRLYDNIARAETIAKARTEKQSHKVLAILNNQREDSRKNTSHKTTKNERPLMSSTGGGLDPTHGQVYWPVRGSILHHYGEQLQGELRWKGMVIGTSEGSEVKVIADGRVILANWLQGYGLVIVVEHGKGDMSLYGYNQSVLVNVGAQVRAGQPIALVGNNGGHGNPSLYFEIRRHGQAINPQPWLSK